MALIGIENALKYALSILNANPDVFGVQILSYKRNRYVSIIRNGNDFWLQEKGYLGKEWISSPNNLPKILKSVFKREFPRSRKVRVIRLEKDCEARNDLKKI